MNEPRGRRFLTLDVFRGLTLFLMFIVNTQGSGAIPFAPLRHSEWNGCTLTDLVFPSFLFAVGNALAFVSRKWSDWPDRRVLYLIGKRTLLIFLIGYLLTWYCSMSWSAGHLVFAHFSDTRIMAVLQRIALCYGLTAILARWANERIMLGAAMGLLLAYWALLYFCGTKGMPYSEAGNFVRQVDLSILGEKHMYREQGLIFDPEGLLSTLPATVNVMAGYLTGNFLIRSGKTRSAVATLLVTGGLLIVLGRFWDLYFPMNKKLWTSSFVLFTTGFDLLVIGILLYGLEIRQRRILTRFFVVLGKNPLFLYVLSNLLFVLLIWPVKPEQNFFDWMNAVFFQRLAPGPWGSLLFSVCFALLCWSAGWLMDKWKIYVRI